MILFYMLLNIFVPPITHITLHLQGFSVDMSRVPRIFPQIMGYAPAATVCNSFERFFFVYSSKKLPKKSLQKFSKRLHSKNLIFKSPGQWSSVDGKELTTVLFAHLGHPDNERQVEFLPVQITVIVELLKRTEIMTESWPEFKIMILSGLIDWIILK